MSRYIEDNETLKIIKKMLYETALNNFTTDRKFADDCEEIAEHRLATWIGLVPTADVVKVVRCKDCRYWQDYQEGHYPNELCPWDKNETTDEDDYCSFGERREDDKGRNTTSV